MDNPDKPLPNRRFIPPLRFALRLVWVVVQLMLVYWLGESGSQFFYQGF
jgi:hypothetical protein